MKIKHPQLLVFTAIMIASALITPISVTHALDINSNQTVAKPPTNETTSSTTAANHVAAIIAKGDQEITRRLDSLTKLTDKITATTHISSADKAYLTSEVTTEVTGLQTLKTKLDADTTLADVHIDVQSILAGYRVYALVMPKIALIRTADNEQVTDARLTSLATKLQTRLTADQTQNKSVSDLQTKLDDMTTQTKNAQVIASAIESKVLTLQPTDYNSDHTLLSGDRDQLKTAHADNLAAITDAKAIIQALKAQ